MAVALGTTDEITVCDCCGKVDLKLTVIMRLDDGQIVNYGTTCAGRNTGKTKQQIRDESRAHAEASLAAAQAEFKASPEAAAERLAFDTRPRGLIGMAAAEWVAPASAAADDARKRICAKHGIADRWLSLHR
jgi:hypothetical protein